MVARPHPRRARAHLQHGIGAGALERPERVPATAPEPAPWSPRSDSDRGGGAHGAHLIRQVEGQDFVLLGLLDGEQAPQGRISDGNRTRILLRKRQRDDSERPTVPHAADEGELVAQDATKSALTTQTAIVDFPLPDLPMNTKASPRRSTAEACRVRPTPSTGANTCTATFNSASKTLGLSLSRVASIRWFAASMNASHMFPQTSGRLRGDPDADGADCFDAARMSITTAAERLRVENGSTSACRSKSALGTPRSSTSNAPRGAKREGRRVTRSQTPTREQGRRPESTNEAEPDIGVRCWPASHPGRASSCRPRGHTGTPRRERLEDRLTHDRRLLIRLLHATLRLLAGGIPLLHDVFISSRSDSPRPPPSRLTTATISHARELLFDRLPSST